MNRTLDLNRIEKACMDKGLRMTEQRRVIARVVAEAYDHPDAEELYRRAVAVDPHISIATVYRTVKLFEDAGILERHDFRDGRARYEEISDHHDHLIDLSTGTRDRVRATRTSNACSGAWPKSSVLIWSTTGWSSTACPKAARSRYHRRNNIMATLRAAGITAVFLTVTLLLMPVQWLAVRLHSGWQRRLPHLYHRFICRLMGARITVLGTPVAGGVLLTANHSGWLDIPILSAVTPVSFVAKQEVNRWPFFGTLARLQRTVFIRRERSKALEDRDNIRRRLTDGDALVIFPEGTSGDGNHVLPFKSALSRRPMGDGANGPHATRRSSRSRCPMSGCTACRWAGKTAPFLPGMGTWTWSLTCGRRSAGGRSMSSWSSMSHSPSMRRADARSSPRRPRQPSAAVWSGPVRCQYGRRRAASR